MALVIHGTICAKDFLKNKNAVSKNSCWSCSSSDPYVYVWSFSRFQNEFDKADIRNIYSLFKKKDFIEFKSQAHTFLQHARESAQAQAAHYSKDCEIRVYVLDVPDKYLEDDDSCENMTMAQRFEIKDFKKSWIKAVYVEPYSNYYTPFLLSLYIDNQYYCMHEVDPQAATIATKVLIFQSEAIYLGFDRRPLFRPHIYFRYPIQSPL